MRSIYRNTLLLAFLGLIYVTSHVGILHRHHNNSLTQQQPSTIESLPTLLLQIISGEFKGIVANFAILEAGAQIGTELKRTPDGKYKTVKKIRNWENIHQLFVKSQALDPYFKQTYNLAQGVLPWDPGMVKETQAILHRSALALPWDWRPLHYVGFNHYFHLNEPDKAGKIFLEAAKIKDAPAFLSLLGARLAQRGNATEAAIILMKSVLAGKDRKDPSYGDIEDRLHALEGSLVIENAIKSYHKRFNHTPISLNDLLESGILKSIPQNPYNQSYCISKDGSVHFDVIGCDKTTN